MFESLIAQPGYVFVNKINGLYGQVILLGKNDSVENYYEEKIENIEIKENDNNIELNNVNF